MHYKKETDTLRMGLWALVAFLSLSLMATPRSFAATAEMIDAGVKDALDRLQTEVKGGSVFLSAAKGVLVFPSIYKAGVGIGGEYGEGALLIGSKTVAYYNTVAASVGLQLGAQARTLILVFLKDEALQSFRESRGWKVGVDGSVALINLGAGEALDSISITDPIVGFVFGQQGLMYNLTLEGAKFTKIKR